MDYYLDESGSTGDLVPKKINLSFGNQPIFAHACFGINENDKEEFFSFIENLKKKYLIDGELKSEHIYFKHPELIFEISEYMKDNVVPFFCEVMDKKYNVSVSIVNHQIIPTMENERDGHAQFIRNVLTDYLSIHGSSKIYEDFMKLCRVPSEENLLKSFNALKSFFQNESEKLIDKGLTLLMIDKTISEYYEAKKEIGVTQAISYFMPIPDLDNNNNIVSLTPHVHCFYNIIGRLNKYHLQEIHNITLHHDEQREFSSSIEYCLEKLKSEIGNNHAPIPNADFSLKEELNLIFENSEQSIEIQVSDLLAGFMNRFINGFLYKRVDISDIYIKTFNNLVHYNRFQRSPLGVNFVLPLSLRERLFSKFEL